MIAKGKMLLFLILNFLVFLPVRLALIRNVLKNISWCFAFIVWVVTIILAMWKNYFPEDGSCWSSVFNIMSVKFLDIE